jgi:hypothetical protein
VERRGPVGRCRIAGNAGRSAPRRQRPDHP